MWSIACDHWSLITGWVIHRVIQMYCLIHAWPPCRGCETNWRVSCPAHESPVTLSVVGWSQGAYNKCKLIKSPAPLLFYICYTNIHSSIATRCQHWWGQMSWSEQVCKISSNSHQMSLAEEGGPNPVRSHILFRGTGPEGSLSSEVPSPDGGAELGLRWGTVQWGQMHHG